jgi:hypothetical protein
MVMVVWANAELTVRVVLAQTLAMGGWVLLSVTITE